MLAFGALLLSIGLDGPSLDTLPAVPVGDSVSAASAVAVPRRTVRSRGAADSAQGRPKVIELSDWYYRRLTIHRSVPVGIILIFAAQCLAGERLYDDIR